MNKQQFTAELMMILYLGTLNPMVMFEQGSGEVQKDGFSRCPIVITIIKKKRFTLLKKHSIVAENQTKENPK
jgi:hypothetical protein